MKANEDLFDLSGQIALITGGSRGLGRQMALAFAKAGADIAITSRKREACEAVAREVEALGRRAFVWPCHIGDWDGIGELETRKNRVISGWRDDVEAARRTKGIVRTDFQDTWR
ncbi:SDR family NAD(P)-dependent oxidoreductase [Sphingobium phenoxybenzoativorans]|uniref:SDR family NAD(P)-dependent oxidoreductase n=1 Tax=Sphingobium phenoxybenzoativorans TaxID=1592790 RepID=UPI001FE8EDEF|nr:SDR family NAD(P)-dependent oxidoreductase [Sphingobium phenoxybenzoativorans]